MIDLEFPEPFFKTRYDGDKAQIFDEIRKIWLVLNPEEWVRQNTISLLTKVYGIPSSRIAIEKCIEVSGMAQRFDILIYDNSLKPWMLIECKSQVISLSEKTLMQILRYHLSVPVKYIMVINGNEAHIAENGINGKWLKSFPIYQ